MTKKLTNEEFVERISEKLPNIIILGNYISSQERILVSCKNHINFQWYPLANNLLRGYGCKYCAAANKKSCQPMDQIEFENRLNDINENIKVLGKYINNHTSILIKCLVDGYQWNPTPSDLLEGKGCPKCGKVYRRTHEEFCLDVFNIDENIKIIGKFENIYTKIDCLCLIDGYRWNPVAGSLLNGRGCPKCSRRYKRTTEEFIADISDNYPNIEVIGNFKGVHTRILLKCKIDGFIWDSIPCKLLNKTIKGCPKCNDYLSEKLIEDYLYKNHIDYIRGYSFDDLVGMRNKKLVFDFAIIKNNNLFCLIEADGIYHYKKIYENQKLERQQERDSLKNIYCKNNNFKLIRIPYWEYKNIDNILETELSPLLERR